MMHADKELNGSKSTCRKAGSPEILCLYFATVNSTPHPSKPLPSEEVKGTEEALTEAKNVIEARSVHNTPSEAST